MLEQEGESRGLTEETMEAASLVSGLQHHLCLVWCPLQWQQNHLFGTLSVVVEAVGMI